MAILLTKNVVFLHIPKTGGSWVVKAIKDNGLYEMNLGQAHSDHERVSNYSGHYLGSYLRNSFKLRYSVDAHLKKCQYFCFVRDPITYYESVWRFYYGEGWPQFSAKRNYSRFGLKTDLWHPWAQFGRWGKMEFSPFISRVIDECPGFLANLYERYIPYDSGVIVGKQEDLRSDFIRIITELYGPRMTDALRLPSAINQSKFEKPTWQRDLKKEIVRLEYSVYRRFKYKAQH